MGRVALFCELPHNRQVYPSHSVKQLKAWEPKDGPSKALKATFSRRVEGQQSIVISLHQCKLILKDHFRFSAQVQAIVRQKVSH